MPKKIGQAVLLEVGDSIGRQGIPVPHQHTAIDASAGRERRIIVAGFTTLGVFEYRRRELDVGKGAHLAHAGFGIGNQVFKAHTQGWAKIFAEIVDFLPVAILSLTEAPQVKGGITYQL